MLEEAGLKSGERVLEIGTGSGYHAALLASLVGPRNVVTMERNRSLAEWGRSNLAAVGFADVTVVVGDGSLGHPAGLAGLAHPPVAEWPQASSGRLLYNGSAGLASSAARMRSTSRSFSAQ